MKTGTNDKIGGGGFHHIAFSVRDFDATVKFYTEALGCRQHLAWTSGAGTRATLLDMGDGNFVEVFENADLPDDEVGQVMHYAFRSDDVDVAVAEAVAGGAEVTMTPKELTIPSDPPLDVRLAFVKAPGGQVVEFFTEL